jgi:hypothetical protein
MPYVDSGSADADPEPSDDGDNRSLAVDSDEPDDDETPDDGSYLQRSLAARGVPMTALHVRWPLGLRLLASDDGGDLRDQVEALMLILADQRSQDAADPDLLREAHRAVDKLQRLVGQDKEQARVPLAVCEEAESFLDRLRKALRLLR